MSEEPLYRTYTTFDNDQAYYEKVGPWNLSKLNAANLREEKTHLRILSGADNSHLRPTLQEYDEWLKDLNIRQTFVKVAGAGHGKRIRSIPARWLTQRERKAYKQEI
jgi:hypothetical protein